MKKTFIPTLNIALDYTLKFNNQIFNPHAGYIGSLTSTHDIKGKQAPTVDSTLAWSDVFKDGFFGTIKDYKSIDDIIESNVWKQFYDQLKQNRGPKACWDTCRTNKPEEDKQEMVFADKDGKLKVWERK